MPLQTLSTENVQTTRVPGQGHYNSGLSAHSYGRPLAHSERAFVQYYGIWTNLTKFHVELYKFTIISGCYEALILVVGLRPIPVVLRPIPVGLRPMPVGLRPMLEGPRPMFEGPRPLLEGPGPMLEGLGPCLWALGLCLLALGPCYRALGP